jgi:hypothetical protein
MSTSDSEQKHVIMGVISVKNGVLKRENGDEMDE